MVNKDYYIKPNWDIFNAHIESFIPRDLPDYARQVCNLLHFSYLEDNQINNILQKTTFEEIDYIPPCIKYRPPEQVTYIDAFITPEKMTPIVVKIESLFSTDYDHFLNLHPGRYDRVKAAICRGKIDMPQVHICDQRFPRVDDGRHRVIALYKYGFSEITVLVPEKERLEITYQLKKSIKIQRPLKAEFISSDEQKRLSLFDFDFSRLKNINGLHPSYD